MAASYGYDIGNLLELLEATVEILSGAKGTGLCHELGRIHLP